MSLIEKLQQEEASAKSEAITTYREILARNASPEPTDAKKLKAAMQTLGFTPDRLAADLNVLQETACLEATIAALPVDLAERVKAAGNEWEAYNEETQRIRQERLEEGNRLFGRIREIQAIGNAPSAARTRLKAIRTRHWELLGEPEPKPVEPESTILKNLW